MNHKIPLFKTVFAVNKSTCVQIMILVDNHEYVRKPILCAMSDRAVILAVFSTKTGKLLRRSSICKVTVPRETVIQPVTIKQVSVVKERQGKGMSEGTTFQEIVNARLKKDKWMR